MKNNILEKLSAFRNFISSHKKISIIVFILIIIIGYFGYKKFFVAVVPTQYVTTQVVKGNVVESITGSGQVSVLNQIDLKSKNSGTIVYVGVNSGDVVKKGKVLFSLDTHDAKKAVRDALINLESSQLSLDKLKIQNSNDNMNANLQKSYDDGFSFVSSALSDLSSTILGLSTILNQQNLSNNAVRPNGSLALTYRTNAELSYYKAKSAFDKNLADFRLIDRNSPKADIENILNETYDTTSLLSVAIKNTKNFVDYLVNDTGRPSDYTSSTNSLVSYTNTIDGDLSNISSSKSNIKNYKDTFPNSDLDIKGAILSMEQRQNSLQDAKDALSDYYVVAPFDGTISSVTAKSGDIASGVLGSIVTNQKLATISLNEVDITKIKLGQKATLTFDAIDGLSITGEVVEIDTVGTVSQGVVSYNVKISFDVKDSRIKPGMSISATIITNTAQDVLIVPNSAVKTKNKTSYIEVFSSPLAPVVSGSQGSISLVLPNQIQIQTGLVNDVSTEIISGLKEGDIVVTKTITGTSVSTATQTPSILGAIGGNRSGASSGAMRAVTGR